MTSEVFIPLRRSKVTPPTETQIAAGAREVQKTMHWLSDLSARHEFLELWHRATDGCECWASTQYTVLVTRDADLHEAGWPAMDWLSIRRADREPVRNWRHVQAIKNQLCGPEREGVELYPAESRLVDAANQYHVFVFRDREVRLPFGYRDRGVSDGLSPALGGKQEPLPPAPKIKS